MHEVSFASLKTCRQVQQVFDLNKGGMKENEDIHEMQRTQNRIHFNVPFLLIIQI